MKMDKCPICNKSYLKLETKGVDTSACPSCIAKYKIDSDMIRWGNEGCSWTNFEAKWNTK